VSHHSTIRGFDSSGRLTFTCHLTTDPATDEAWIYEVSMDESTVERGALVVLKSKYGATVKVQTSAKESKKNFLNLEMEYICGTSLLTYIIFKLNIYVR
jgi:hypothetical protein